MKIKESLHGFRTRTINSASKWWKKHTRPPLYPQYYNQECHYLDGLYTTLLTLKPKYCLEIGTHDGMGSTKVFEKYFNEHEPDGCVITLDIVPCKNLDPCHKNIHQVVVAPHHQNIVETCGANGSWFVKDDLALFEKFANSLKENLSLVSKKMNELGIEKFDLAFIDGDHEEKSFMNDIEFCKILTYPPHYLVLDDTKEEVHPCCHIYHSDIKNSDTYDCYNFEDWEKFVGMSVIRCR